MFAIDGVKLPSNADKRRSGTHAELARDAQRMEAAAQRLIAAHGRADHVGEGGTSDSARLERLRDEAQRIREFLAAQPERMSAKGAVRKSNVTDNDSAKMATQKGSSKVTPAWQRWMRSRRSSSPHRRSAVEVSKPYCCR